MSPETPESPEPIAELTADTAAPNRRRSILGGALLGAVALTASVVAVGAVAGAQDEPEVDEPAAMELDEIDDDAEVIELDEGDLDEIELDDGMIEVGFDDEAWAAFDQCLTDALGDISEDADLSDEEWEALEQQFGDAEAACEDLIPEDVKAEIAAYEPYEECIDGQLGDLDDIEGEIDEAQIAELDAAWMAADEACFDLLPEDAKAEAEAFKAYDQCLTDAGLGGEDTGTVVFIEDGESGQSIVFGENAGTVTITGDASGVAVATDGDVSVLDDGAFEAAFEACDDLLPEGLFDIDEFEVADEAEFDIEDGDEAELDDDGDEDDNDDA